MRFPLYRVLDTLLTNTTPPARPPQVWPRPRFFAVRRPGRYHRGSDHDVSGRLCVPIIPDLRRTRSLTTVPSSILRRHSLCAMGRTDTAREEPRRPGPSGVLSRQHPPTAEPRVSDLTSTLPPRHTAGYQLQSTAGRKRRSAQQQRHDGRESANIIRCRDAMQQLPE